MDFMIKEQRFMWSGLPYNSLWKFQEIMYSPRLAMTKFSFSVYESLRVIDVSVSCMPPDCFDKHISDVNIRQ